MSLDGNAGHKYRADIDGLRAIAVLSVVIFHGFPSLLPGGFVGVDIFFVISGYLISSIIYSDLEKDRFSIVSFYNRRIRRIFPALLTILAASAAFGWLVLLPKEFATFGKHLAGGATFVSNLVLWREIGYFDTFADSKPMLHLWSLAIEEQFYLFWPLLMLAAWRLRKNLLVVLLAVTAISFGLNILLMRGHQTAAYYLPLTRSWELFIGGILAHLNRQGPGFLAGRKNLQAALGAGLVVLGLIFISKERAFPGYWALLPTIGAFLLISAEPGSWINRNILSNKLLVWVGLISYPLYLWHWPVLAFLRIVEDGKPTVGQQVAAILASVLLAWATYLFIESPIRFGKPQRSPIPGLALGMVLVLALGLAAQANLIRVRHDGGSLAPLIAASDDWTFPGNLEKAAERAGRAYHIRSARPEATLFFGDSHMEQYAPRILDVLERRSGSANSMYFVAEEGCPPIPDVRVDSPEYPGCEENFLAGIELADRPEVRTIVVGGCWNCYFIEQAQPKKKPSDLDYYTIENGAKHYFRTGTGATMALRNLERFLSGIGPGKKVYLVLDNPFSKTYDPRTYMIGGRLRGIEAVPMVDSMTIDAAQASLRTRLAEIAARHGVEVLDPLSKLCSGSRCATADRGEPIYVDLHHFRARFARERASFLDTTLFR